MKENDLKEISKYAKFINYIDLPSNALFIGQILLAYGYINYYICGNEYYKVYFDIGD